jgi:hypothetical protein
LLHEAHRVKLRAFETVWRAQAEVAQMPPAPPAVATAAPVEPSDTGNRTEGWSVLFSIQEKMDQMPEVFDKNDVAAALGFMPKRATLFRALDELRADGWIQDESPSEGRRPARYRKLAQPDSQSA